MDITAVAAMLVIGLYAVAEIVKVIAERSKSKGPELEQEIISMVNEGHEQGVLETSEAAMISNIFDFVDKEASEIMTNRSNIIAIDKTMGLVDALNFMLRNSNSRYPVYDENLDHVIGILYLKDAMRFRAKDETLDKPVSEIKGLIRKALFIPETMNVNELFKTMQSKKTQMAIVIDEYGQTAGLIAMEDILEEIVGNIMDEYDVEEKHIRKKGADTYIIDGFTSLSDIEKLLKIEFKVDNFETINGFMISRLDRLPEKDEQFTTEVDGYEFSILEVKNRTISKIIAKKQIKKEEETE